MLIPFVSIISPAVTALGPCSFKLILFGPSTSIPTAIAFRFKTMSVTSSRTPGIEENSCNTVFIFTEVIAAP